MQFDWWPGDVRCETKINSRTLTTRWACGPRNTCASDIEGGQQKGAAGADNLRRPEQAVRVKRYRSARGPTMMARIGTLRAPNRHVDRVFDSSRKETHWGKRKLKRDK